MIKRKKASTLLEIIIGLAIISILISISVSLIINSNEAIELRKTKVNDEYIVYSVMEEIKYNFTTEEILEVLEAGSVYISSKDFFSNILECNLFDLRTGTDIKIELKDKALDNTLTINITLSRKDGINMVERTFKKYSWMEN